MTRRPVGQSGPPPRHRQISVDAADFSGVREQAAEVQGAHDLNEGLARELVQGLVQSAVARGGDPVARLQEFRTLQEAAMATSQNPAVAETAERLVRAIDLTLQELTALKL